MPQEEVSEFVKALLDQLLTNKGMHRHSQERLEIHGLPPCMCDITIMIKDVKVKDGVLVGVVETKSLGNLIQKSVVQCALQLVAIHT